MLARNVCFEDITNAINRVDKLGLKRIVPLRTQPAHDDIDNVSIGFESDASRGTSISDTKAVSFSSARATFAAEVKSLLN